MQTFFLKKYKIYTFVGIFLNISKLWVHLVSDLKTTNLIKKKKQCYIHVFKYLFVSRFQDMSLI